MRKNSSVLKVLLVIFLIIISLYFDAQIITGVSLIRNNVLDNFFLGLTYASSAVIIFFFLTSMFLWKEHKRKWILPLWISLFISTAVSFILKISIKRLRPYQAGIVSILPTLQENSHLIWNFSFPSFQAMLPFAAIPLLSKEFPRFKYVWFVLASLIAFSRVYFGLHFMSDVIAGALIGYLIGFFVVRMEEENKFWERIYRKILKKD